MNAIGQIDTEAQSELDELAERLTQIADIKNQGEDYRIERRLMLYILGLVIPILLMWIGWYW
jgi:hypothetical protein